MTTFPNSPGVLKSGIVLIDAELCRVLRIISLQCNPEKLTRILQVQGAGGEGDNRSEAMRRKGPAVEMFKLEADIDATDQLAFFGSKKWPRSIYLKPFLSKTSRKNNRGRLAFLS
ncbi:MAG: hypothetical protein ABL869_02170 [Candidatus Nitrotoga sp.]